ncbi:hypothetical protein [Streptomyces sp. NBC_01233]|uniref:hypothetical protein n=1 Tax=Streptomyces sp. NBC_01233 TaxID=2903787 RepID=UPI002E11A571|nr:hypothetical protein OG332_10560 [Streptomyces sp. NBC_01233]
MTARRPRRAPPPAEGQLLDWSDRRHWARVQAPCRYCRTPTFLRDDDNLPADKVCAEKALQQRAERATAAYQNGQL